jgi:hypothetical protein
MNFEFQLRLFFYPIVSSKEIDWKTSRNTHYKFITQQRELIRHIQPGQRELAPCCTRLPFSFKYTLRSVTFHDGDAAQSGRCSTPDPEVPGSKRARLRIAAAFLLFLHIFLHFCVRQRLPGSASFQTDLQQLLHATRRPMRPPFRPRRGYFIKKVHALAGNAHKTKPMWLIEKE